LIECSHRQKKPALTKISIVVFLTFVISAVCGNADFASHCDRYFTSRSSIIEPKIWGRRRRSTIHSTASFLSNRYHPKDRLLQRIKLQVPRGGSSEVEENVDEDESINEVTQTINIEDDSNEEENEEDEQDGDDDEEHEEEEDDEEEERQTETTDTSDDNVDVQQALVEYDEPFVPSSWTNLYVSFGVMMLAKRIDLYNPKIVRVARFAFVAYLILLELFVLYVRIQAKRTNDLTPIEISNPLSSVLKSQIGGNDGSGNLLKSLATSLLSSSTTILEYDLKQANGMQSGLIFSILFVWFMHFKMNQVQPLLIQTANGIIQMVYSPLFQVYILGRNLERPFPNPSPSKRESETNDAESEIVSETENSAATEEEVDSDEATIEEDIAVDEDDSEDNENDESAEDEADNDEDAADEND
jgi:hypothetical protein